MDLREAGCEDGEVDGTGSGSCPVASFYISGAEPLECGVVVPIS
jgi:hypothetical protein